jgi:Flp pilus assembly protein TadD
MQVRKMNALSRAAAPLLVALPWVLGGVSAQAQDHAVVQALPPPAASELTAALQRLARSPGDFDALIAAGRASLELNDIDAATGFFGRADAVRPGDARVKAGLASANLKSGRPIEALQMFDQAQAAGAPPATLAADRGLAYDLVGDNASAQAQYRLALTQGADPEISRRLGLSLAISGDKKGFEAALLPLLQRRDFAAYRARAFGLAILGNETEAESIVEAVMPRDLASRITPYLGYMPKLTRAQQAAAGNLGAFPRAAQIGRDDPRFAQYAGPSAVPATQGGADSRLAPAGQPLGPKAQAAPSTSSRQSTADRKRERDARRSSGPAAGRRQGLRPPVYGPPVATARTAQTPTPTSVRVTPPPSPPPPSASLPAPAIELPPQPVVVAQVPPSSAAPGFELAPGQARDPQSSTAAAPPVIVLAVPPPAASQAEEDLSVADAFADLTNAHRASAPAAGAVDITAIKPKREAIEPPQASKPKPAPPPPPPPKPKAPSRVWVQVATGKDLKALAFDWRRFGKKAPELLAKRDGYTAKWGESRRLVTGPFDSEKAASKFVSDLKKAGVDAFTFTSELGEEVVPLK